MPITKESIKVMASENLTDYDDGGGMMSGNEIVSGNVNNMFPDISRLDRVYGRVSLRKAFISAMTDDNDVYSGVHVILDDPPDDPNVSVTLFSRKDFFDHRTDARDRVESYVVQGVRYNGYLLGNQLEGARSIQLAQRETIAPPNVGDVLYFAENEGLITEFSQFVRITEVSSEARTFTVPSGSGYTEIRRLVVTCGIGDPLRYTFHGADPSINDAQGKAVPYTTSVADAAKYYGVKNVVQAVSPGEFTIRASGIFNNLVPSAQAETPVVDIIAGGNTSCGIASGSGSSFSVSLAPVNGTKIYCGNGLAPGSLNISSSGGTWVDDSDGNLVRAGTIEGAVDYGSGTVTFTKALGSAVYTVSFTSALTVSGINRTMGILVSIASRAYNYTATLIPKPAPGTVVADYMSQGNWYRLKANAAGELVPLVQGTGTGVFNNETGSVILTCGALPDVDSTVMFSWMADVEYEQSESTVINNAFRHVFKLPRAPVEPLSVGFSYDGVLVYDYKVDGEDLGRLHGVNGTIDYNTGEIIIIPEFLKKTAGIQLSINASYRAPEEVAISKSGMYVLNGGPGNSLFSIGPCKPYSVSVGPVGFNIDKEPISLVGVDNGSGSIVTPSTYRVVSMTGGNLDETRYYIPKGTLLGHIDYATGDIALRGVVQGVRESLVPTYGWIQTAGWSSTEDSGGSDIPPFVSG